MIRRLLLLWLFGPALFVAAAAEAQHTAPASTAVPANPGGLTAAEAQRALEVVQDPEKRALLIETLQAIAKTAPQGSEKPAALDLPSVTLAPDSLGAQVLSGLSSWPERLAGEAALTAQVVTDFPMLWRWARRLVTDPGERLDLLNALWQLALVVACALALEWLARVGLARPIAILAAYAPNSAHAPDGERGNGAPEPAVRHVNGAWHLLRRLPFSLARLLLELIPVGIFWGAGSLFAGIASAPLPRFAILVGVNAYALGRIIMAVGGMLVSPTIGRLRLLEIGDDEARYLILWLRRITTVAVVGAALASLALLFGLNPGAYETLIGIVALIVAVLLGVLVLRNRHRVALRLRAQPGAHRGIAPWRDRLAGAWHYLALTLIVAGWILWATGIRNGLGGLRLLVGTVAIAVAARLVAIVVFGMLDRAGHLSPELAQVPLPARHAITHQRASS